MKYFHYSKEENVQSILQDGLKRSDGAVFMTDSIDAILTFASIYNAPEDDEKINIFIFEVEGEALEPDKLVESTDHNEDYIKCNAYMYLDDIPAEHIRVNTAYTLEHDDEMDLHIYPTKRR